jgi:hypothetical protein
VAQTDIGQRAPNPGERAVKALVFSFLRQRMIRILIAMVAGIIATISYQAHFVHNQLVRPIDRVIVFTYFAILFSAFAYMLLFRLLVPHLRRLGRHAYIGWLFSVAAASIALVVIAVPRPQAPIFHQLEVLATGEKNPSARDSQIWIVGLYDANKQPIPLANFTYDSAWEIKDEKLAFLGPQPASAHWSGTLEGDVELVLVAHPWSGVAQIRWDNQTQAVDLFADTEANSTRTIQLSGSAQGAWWSSITPYSALIAITDLLTLCMLLLALGMWAAGRRARTFTAASRRGHISLNALGIGVFASLLLGALFGPLMLARRDGSPLSLLNHLIAWAYAALALGVAWCFWAPEPWLRALIPRRLPRQLRWLTREMLGQRVGVWLATIAGCAVAAALLTDRSGVGAPQALWVRLTLDSSDQSAPTTNLRYSDQPANTVPFRWQPLDQTLVSVRPLDDNAGPLYIQSVETDTGPLDLATIEAGKSSLTADGLALSDPKGTLLSWPQVSRAITLTFAAARGSAEVLWLDQSTQVDLRQPQAQAALKLPATFQGWALLPPHPVHKLALELPASGATYTIRELDLSAAAPATNQWVQRNVALWQASGCAVNPQAGALTVSTTNSQPCVVRLPLPAPFNSGNTAAQFGMWLALLLLLILSLLALAWSSSLLRRWGARYRITDNRVGAWLRATAGASRLTPRHVMLLVWLVALLWGVGYAVYVPINYSYDTLDYFGASHALTRTHQFSSIYPSTRTPGYPVFIAVAERLFADSALGVVLLQHMAIALLAPLTVWATHRRLTLWPSALIGLWVACSPTLSISANMLMSELTFGVLAAAAILLYLRRGHNLRSLILVGALIGAATMIRPTGLLLLAIALGWIALCTWCDTKRARQMLAAGWCVALVAGYLVVAGPWHIHLAVVRKTTDLSQGLASFTSWAGAVYQHRVTADLPTSRPEQAVWSTLHTWNYDPYAVLAQRQILDDGLIDRQTYYRQSLSEANRINRAQFFDIFQRSFVYNLSFRRDFFGSDDYWYWEELIVPLQDWARGKPSPQPPVPDPNVRALQQRIEAQIDRSYLHASPLRRLYIGVSYTTRRNWLWLALPSLLSLPILLSSRVFRRLAPAWLFWMALVVSTSAISFPAERYMVVVEPLLYVLAGTLLTFVLLRRLQRRSTLRISMRNASNHGGSGEASGEQPTKLLREDNA